MKVLREFLKLYLPLGPERDEPKVCCCATTFSFSVVCRRSEEESEVKGV